MGTSNCCDEFKRDAVHQIAVREVSRQLGVSTHSLYKWLKLFGEPTSKTNSIDHEAENQRLKRELARVTEERDILKGEFIVRHWSEDNGRAHTSRASPNEVRFHPGHVPGATGPFQRLQCMA